MKGIDLDTPPCEQARDAARVFASRGALVDVGSERVLGRAEGSTRRWDFATFWAEAEQLAAGLQGLGLERGDRVALWMANRAEFVLLSFAVEIAGLVRVPLNPRYTSHEVAQIAADCTPALLVVDDHRASEVPRAIRTLSVDQTDWRALGRTPVAGATLYSARADDLCSLNYTSGSTGAAKGVMLTHRNWAAVYRNLLTDRDIQPDDRLVHIGPLSHASGAYVPAFFLAGATNVIAPPGERLPAGQGLDGLLQTIQQERGTVFTAVPTLLTRLVNYPTLHDFNLSSLRWIGYGAEPIPPGTLAAAIDHFGPILTANYGLTEAMMTVCHLRPDEHFQNGQLRQGAIGRPYTHVEVVVRDADGTPVPGGEIGELTVRSPHVMRGYWNRAGDTAHVLKDGWLWSGDLARVGPDGILELKGRAKDMLICGGFNIYPQQVEHELAAAPGVREVAVVGSPDAEWGEIVVAFVVGEHLQEQRLRDWARPRLGLRTPKRWVLLDALPRNATGKVDRPALRQLAGNQEAAQ
jgi:acyl-CoA synthetase (AMP-forming)/AMP-acid ligase II